MQNIKRKTKPLIPILLTICMALTLILLFSTPVLAADKTVAIAPEDTETAIKTAIQAAIDDVKTAGGGTVTVIGSKTDVTVPITLSIPADVTVIWKAEYKGEIFEHDVRYSDNVLIVVALSGGGFEVASGTDIEAYFPVKGGYALHFIGDSNFSSNKVTVSGGSVKAYGSPENSALYIKDANMEMSGGTITSFGDEIITI